MNKEVETGMAVKEPVGELTARQELETLLNESLPEELRTGDVDQMALNWIKKQMEMNDRIAEAIGGNPSVAQMFVDIANGEKPGVSVVRRFGKALIEAEEGTPEYDELMAAEQEFTREREAAAERALDHKARANAWFDAFEEYLEEEYKDKEKLVKIEEEVLLPAIEYVIDKKLFKRLVNSVDYEKDVDDAFQAGEVKGRNMNINEMRSKPSDGMPSGLSSQAPVVERPKRAMNPLIAKALKA